MKMTVFWDIAACSMMTEAASTSETSVTFYQTTQRNIHLHTRRREKLKSDQIVEILYSTEA
jgi:hypothetical protein